MTDIQIGLLSIVGILFLIYAGMHVSIALMLLSLLGVWLIKDNWLFRQLWIVKFTLLLQPI